MKKFILILAVLLLITCKKDFLPKPVPEPPGIPAPIEVSVDYGFTLVGNGPMKSYQLQYAAFHQKYILGRILTPTTYNLVFTGKKGLVMPVSGSWTKKTYFSLPSDEYTVSGTSYPKSFVWSGDTAYFRFNQVILVDKNTTVITLEANYDCFLCLFSNTGIISTNVHNPYDSKTFMAKTEDFYHVFFQANNGPTDYRFVEITRDDGTVSKIMVKDYNMLFGNYYYFSFVDAAYTLNPMVE